VRIAANPERFTRVFVDVGAADGSDSIPVARGDATTFVVAFEPTPALARVIRARVSTLPNYHLVEAAVDEAPGERSFNTADLGCGSLLDLAKQGWLEVEVEERLRVRVVRLDAVLGALGIDRVDFLHCDAQGTDLRVLRSLGDISVCEGVVEVPARSKLYEGGHSRREAFRYLADHGFGPLSIGANDSGGHEQNVLFRRSSAPRVLRLLTFWALAVQADLRVVPHRIRVAVGLRSRLKRLPTARALSTAGSAEHAHLPDDD
jgi:FkbM family methyltransferase